MSYMHDKEYEFKDGTVNHCMIFIIFTGIEGEILHHNKMLAIRM